MKKLYLVSSYDKVTREHIGCIPISPKAFRALSKQMKLEKQSCYEVTKEVREILESKFHFSLSSKMDYQLEIVGDYELEIPDSVIHT